MSIVHKLRAIRKTFSDSAPLVEVGISRANLLHNLHAYQTMFPELAFAPVLKSNAYGHGLIEVAQILDQEKIAFFAVDSFFEAKALRAASIHSKVLVFDYVRPEEIAKNSLKNVEYGIVDITQLKTLRKILKQKTRVHLKVDTGMHRQGILMNELDAALELLKANPNFEVTGVFTHLAEGGKPNAAHTKFQRTAWENACSRVLAAFPKIKHRHFGATDGMPLNAEAKATVGRLGMGLYGFGLIPNAPELKPVLELRSLITSLRTAAPGETVGYNATFTMPRETRIATIPVGYFEGVDRRLSNKGSMLVRGKIAPVVGRVSMNMTSIDVTDIPNVAVLDPVVVISRDRNAKNSVEGIAYEIDTIPYEVLVHIPAHLKRVVE